MRMPVTIAFHHNETPLSAASRLAAANGYASLAQFLQHTGLKASAIEQGDLAAINRLATLSDISATDLSRFALTPLRPGVHKIGDASVRKRDGLANAFRCCPCCIVQDRDTGIGKPIARAYHRYDWLLPGLDHCVVHRVGLLCLKASRDIDFSRAIDRHYAEIASFAKSAAPVDVLSAEEYISKRVDGAVTNHFLDRFELYVAIDLCMHLGRFMEKRTKAVGALTTLERGFAVARGGEEAIDGAVVEAITHRRPHGAAILGFIGALLNPLLKNKADPRYADLLDLLQTIVVRRLPFGPGHTLFRPTDRRVLHSLASASAEYGIGVDRVKAILHAAGLVTGDDSRKADPWFDAEKAHPLLEAAADGLSDGKVAMLLDIGVAAAAELRRSRLFDGEKSRGGKRSIFNVSAAAIAALQVTLRNNAIHRIEKENTIRLSDVVTTVLPTVLKLARDGVLPSLSFHGEGSKLSDFYVDIADLTHSIEKDAATEHKGPELPHGIDKISNVADDLGLPRHVVRQMIKADLMKASVRLNPLSKRRELVVDLKSVGAFKAEHVRLPAIAHKLGVSKEATKSLLENQSIKQKAGGKVLSSKYYARADVDALMRAFSKGRQ